MVIWDEILQCCLKKKKNCSALWGHYAYNLLWCLQVHCELKPHMKLGLLAQILAVYRCTEHEDRLEIMLCNVAPVIGPVVLIDGSAL